MDLLFIQGLLCPGFTISGVYPSLHADYGHLPLLYAPSVISWSALPHFLHKITTYNNYGGDLDLNRGGDA